MVSLITILAYTATLMLSIPLGMALQSKAPEEYEEKEQTEAPEPYYAETAKIAKAVDKSGVEGDYHFKKDTAINLHLEIGKDFQPELFVGGDFKLDWDSYDGGSGDIPRVTPLEWGSNFKVDELVVKANCSPLFDQSIEDENVIRDEALEGLVGETIVYLRYLYGEKDNSSLGYKNYDRVKFPKNFGAEAREELENNGEELSKENVTDKCIAIARQRLIEQFLNGVERGIKEYSDYSPEVLEDDDEDEFGYSGDGAPSDRREGGGSGWDEEEEEDTFAPNDDLPF